MAGNAQLVRIESDLMQRVAALRSDGPGDVRVSRRRLLQCTFEKVKGATRLSLRCAHHELTQRQFNDKRLESPLFPEDSELSTELYFSLGWRVDF